MAELGFFSNVKAIIVMMAFYSVCISMIIHILPADAKAYPLAFNPSRTPATISEIQSITNNNMQQQTNLPIVELGSLLFYSGNFILDLFLNFMFAIPEMLGFLIAIFGRLIGIDAVIVSYTNAFLLGITGAIFLVTAVQYIVTLRSSGAKVGGIV